MRSVVIALCMVFGLAGVAFAAGPAFEDVDKNADGMISEEELASVEGLDFAKVDANGDGQVSRSEYESATEHKGGEAPEEHEGMEGGSGEY